jgi:hypothetical protein
MLYLFASLDTHLLLQIGGALFAAIFGYTSVMDGKQWALHFEWARSLFTLGWAFVALEGELAVFWMGYAGLSLLGIVMVFLKNRTS